MNGTTAAMPPFQAAYAAPDEDLAAKFLANAAREPAAERRVDERARRLVEAIRAKTGGLGGVDDFLHAYALSTKEGLALMVLAEALLRVPDAARDIVQDRFWRFSRMNDACGNPPGDAAFGFAFRNRPDNRGCAGAGARAHRIFLFVRYARRGRAHGRGCRKLFRSLCRSD